MDNKENRQRFGVPPKENIYEEYINKYYIVHPIGTNDQFIGKIKEIDINRGRIILNPYFGLDYNEKSGKDLYNLIYRNFDISWDLTKISFEPTTEGRVLHNCYLSNKERIEKRKSKSRNKRKRIKKQKSKLKKKR